jgi:hypothetical protein
VSKIQGFFAFVIKFQRQFNFGKLSLLFCPNSLSIPLVTLKHVKMFIQMKSRSPLELPNSNGSNYKGVQFGSFKLTSSKDFFGSQFGRSTLFWLFFKDGLLLELKLSFKNFRHLKRLIQHGI